MSKLAYFFVNCTNFWFDGDQLNALSNLNMLSSKFSRVGSDVKKGVSGWVFGLSVIDGST